MNELIKKNNVTSCSIPPPSDERNARPSLSLFFSPSTLLRRPRTRQGGDTKEREREKETESASREMCRWHERRFSFF